VKKAAVIGAGFGGLALAIRLQSAGVATTLIEGRDKPGGRAYHWKRDGYVFDAGPTVITDPNCLKELWALSGRDIADDVELLPVTPFYRLNWPDGTNFRLFERRYRADAGDRRDRTGRRRRLPALPRLFGGRVREGYEKLGHVAFLDFKSMIKAAPSLARYEAWRSVYSIVSRYVKNEKLRQAFSFHTCWSAATR
jgi:phytoene desaturase